MTAVREGAMRLGLSAHVLSHSSYQPDTDEMIQCYLCQDWFHVECLEEAATQGTTESLARPTRSGSPSAPASTSEVTETKQEDEKSFRFVPSERDSGDMVCQACMVTHPFLWDYQHYQRPLPHASPTLATEETKATKETTTQVQEGKAPCMRSTSSSKPTIPYSTFWEPGWRAQLCLCSLCISLYQAEGLSFLLEESQQEDDGETSGDTTPSRAAQSVDLNAAGMQELQAHVPDVSQQLNILHEVDYMQTELRSFLAPLAQSGTVVTKDV